MFSSSLNEWKLIIQLPSCIGLASETDFPPNFITFSPSPRPLSWLVFIMYYQAIEIVFLLPSPSYPPSLQNINKTLLWWWHLPTPNPFLTLSLEGKVPASSRGIWGPSGGPPHSLLLALLSPYVDIQHGLFRLCLESPSSTYPPNTLILKIQIQAGTCSEPLSSFLSGQKHVVPPPPVGPFMWLKCSIRYNLMIRPQALLSQETASSWNKELCPIFYARAYSSS